MHCRTSEHKGIKLETDKRDIAGNHRVCYLTIMESDKERVTEKQMENL